MSDDRKRGQLLTGDLCACWVLLVRQIGLDAQARVRAGSLQKIQHLGIAREWLTLPVFADFAKQAVLNGIPFGRAWWIMANGHRQIVVVAQLRLQIIFPEMNPATIAAAAICQDQQSLG